MEPKPPPPVLPPPKPETSRPKPNRQASPGSVGNTTGLIVPKPSPNGDIKAGQPTALTRPPDEPSLLERFKQSVDDKIDSAVEASGYSVPAMVLGSVAKAANEVLTPTAWWEFVPVGKVAKVAKKGAEVLGVVKKGEKVAEAAQDIKKAEHAGEAATDAKKGATAEKEAAEAGGDGNKNTGGYSKGKGPCDHLKKGNSEGKGSYRGGSYGGTKASEIESHHAPADSVSPLRRSQGSAIQMDGNDHAMTSSHGNKGARGARYRSQIQQLLENGKWREAVLNEIQDIRRVAREVDDPRKYNEAILEMLEYFKCLEKHGLLK